MTEAQAKQYIKEFADHEMQQYANFVLYTQSDSQKDLIQKESHAAIYRYLAEMPSKLWDYIQTKLPKD